MYIPESFAVSESSELQAFMREHSFATLVTQQEGRPFASHIPLLLDGNIGTCGALSGHMARNNPQWQDLASGADVLVIFNGSHAYISPTWYESDSMAAPTWNYMAVHAYGKARILSEDELLKTLHQLVGENEKAFPQPWKLEISQAMGDKALAAIVGFEISLERVEGKFKLSQNRPEQDRRNVIAQLSVTNHGKEVAFWMNSELERN